MGKARKIWGRIGIATLAVAMLVIAGGMGVLLGMSFHTSVNTTFHTVRFSYDNKIVSTQAVVDGKTPVAPFLPSTVTDHNGYEYDFIGWTQDGETVVDPNTIAVTDNANYAAMFKFTGYVSAGTIPLEYVGTYDVPEDQQVSGQYIWQLGNNVYYSNEDEQYKLGADGFTWESQTWYNLAGLERQYIWTYGNYAYYSDGKTQYKLANGSKNWEQQNWVGDFTPLSGKYIWQRGDDVYYSNSSDQYKLNVAENKWEQQEWNGLNSFSGEDVWQYGDDVYYSHSYSYDHYKLANDGKTWDEITWSGYKYIDGKYIWEHDGNVYYSDNSQYKLNVAENKWEKQTWMGLDSEAIYSFYGDRVWQYNGNVYFSYYGENYKLLADGKTWERMAYPTATGKFDSGYFDADDIWYVNGNTYYGSDYQLKDGKWVLITNRQYDNSAISSSLEQRNIWTYVDAVGQEHTYCFYRYEYEDEDGEWYDGYSVAELVDDNLWQTINITKDFGSLYRYNIWEYDGHVYYTNGGRTYEITITADGWNFTRVENFNYDAGYDGGLQGGSHIWHYNGHLYYSYVSVYVDNIMLEYKDGQWVDKEWNIDFDGGSIFQMGGETCAIKGKTLYHLVDGKWKIATMKQDGLSTEITINGEKFYKKNNENGYYYTDLYKYETLYYCPEAKVDNDYVNDHKLNFSNDFGSIGGGASDWGDVDW